MRKEKRKELVAKRGREGGSRGVTLGACDNNKKKKLLFDSLQWTLDSRERESRKTEAGGGGGASERERYGY